MSTEPENDNTTHPKLPPRYDVVFRRLFGDEKDTRLLLGLLNAVLGWDEPLRSVKVKDPSLDGEWASDKEPVLDVLAEDDEGRQYNIEIQVARQEKYLERALYYWARLYTDRLRAGDDYSKLRPTIAVHFLDWTLSELSPELNPESYHSRYGLMDMDTGKRLTNHLEVHIIELPRFDELIDAAHTQEQRWLYFLRHGDTMTTEQTHALGEEIEEADEKLKRISQDRELRSAYDTRVKYERDMRWRIKGPLYAAEQANLKAEQATLKAEQARLEADQARLEADQERIARQALEREADQARLEADQERIARQALEREAEQARLEIEQERIARQTLERELAALRATTAPQDPDA